MILTIVRILFALSPIILGSLLLLLLYLNHCICSIYVVFDLYLYFILFWIYIYIYIYYIATYNSILAIQQAILQLSIIHGWPHNIGSYLIIDMLGTDSYENYPDVGATYTCDDQIKPGVSVTCPVTFGNNKEYVGTMVCWFLYFFILVLYYVYYCTRYPVNYLRYYISMIKASSSVAFRRYMYFGMLITIGTVIYGLVHALGSEVTKGALVVQSIIVFGVVNILILKSLIIGNYNLEHVNVQEQFPIPIIINNIIPVKEQNLSNGYGYVISVHNVFDRLNRSIIMNEYIGDSELINQAIDILYRKQSTIVISERGSDTKEGSSVNSNSYNEIVVSSVSIKEDEDMAEPLL